MVTAMDEIWIELLNSDWHDFKGQGAAEDRLDIYKVKLKNQ